MRRKDRADSEVRHIDSSRTTNCRMYAGLRQLEGDCGNNREGSRSFRGCRIRDDLNFVYSLISEEHHRSTIGQVECVMRVGKLHLRRLESSMLHFAESIHHWHARADGCRGQWLQHPAN